MLQEHMLVCFLFSSTQAPPFYKCNAWHSTYFVPKLMLALESHLNIDRRYASLVKDLQDFERATELK